MTTDKPDNRLHTPIDNSTKAGQNAEVVIVSKQTEPRLKRDKKLAQSLCNNEFIVILISLYVRTNLFVLL